MWGKEGWEEGWGGGGCQLTGIKITEGKRIWLGMNLILFSKVGKIVTSHIKLLNNVVVQLCHADTFTRTCV